MPGILDPEKASETGVVRSALDEQQSRLRAMLDLALAGDPLDQLRKVLDDACDALTCDYAEVGRNDNGTFLKICAVGVDDAEQRTIGASALGFASRRRDRPTMIFDTRNESVWADHMLTGLGLRSVLIWPFALRETRWTIAFGWRVPRETFVLEGEIQYLDFLAQAVGRLIELAEKQRELSNRMVTDPLTALFNRTATLEHLGLSISAAERNGSRVAVFYVDLDRFKEINDTRGHAFGDIALAEMARRMRSVLRKYETAGRIGGDEFAIVITSFNDEAELVAVAKRLLSAVSSPIVHQGIEASLSASIGIALYPSDGATVKDLLLHADSAMYEAKRQGSGRYAFYGRRSNNGARLLAPPQFEPDLEREFLFCYQPIVDSRTGRPIAAEALARWLHPSMGLLAPEAFLDRAREQCAIGRIDRWALSTLTKRGPFHYQSRMIPVHINIGEPDESLLSDRPDTPVPICIEIPENAVASEPNRYIDFFSACRRRGYGVGLSDFGSGGLSLRVLADLPLDFVKVRASDAAPAVIDYAHRIGCTVIAEGVENAAQRERLASSGVDALQGYHICSPLTDSDFGNWLKYRTSA